MKKFILFVSFILVTGLKLDAQTNLKGVVTDSLNNPVPGAAVYLSKTTVGTITDIHGVYSLTIPQQGVYEMITSCIGYIPNSQFISAEGRNQAINIRLSVNLFRLDEVTIKSKDVNRAKNYRLFVRLFLGETSNSRTCKILNPQDLHFYRDNRKMTVNGFSVKPLRIENRALGYIINYELNDFSYNTETGLLRFQGNYYFQPMTGSSQNIKIWARNRLTAYFGSKMHLLRSVFIDSLSRENFELFECVADSSLNEFRIIKPLQVSNLTLLKTGNFRTIFYRSPVLIRYTDKHPELSTSLTGFTMSLNRSTVVFSGFINVYRNGYFDNPYSITWGGEMAKERIADMLPFDFVTHSDQNDGQEPLIDIDSVEKYLLSQQKIHGSDQVFVQADRNRYAPGDTIFLQAYVRDRFTNLFESKGVALYAILFDEKKMIVDSSRFRINNSTSSGWLTIPDKAAPGKYRFIAFTSEMQNFDPADAFQLDLSVKERSAKSHMATDQPDFQKVPEENSNNTSTTKIFSSLYGEQIFNLRFLPEGGNLIEGLDQRIGFIATDSRGRPVFIKGLLKDSSGSVLDTILSGAYGPGAFKCKSQPGMYAELIAGEGGQRIWPLPVPLKTGASLRIIPVNDSSFSVEIQSAGLSGKSARLSVILNTTAVYSEELTLNERQELTVETHHMASGVAQITLFDNELKPLAERLCYVNADKHLRFNIKTERASYAPGQQTELSVYVTDGFGDPVEGVFSISVTDSISGHDARIFTPGIEYTYNYNYNTGFPDNLPPKILEKGLENLGSDDRDLILMVYGWSRYNWDFSDNNIADNKRYDYDLLKMKILYALKSRRADRKLDLVSLEGPSIKHLVTDINGEISLPLDSLPQITRSVTMIPDARNNKRVTAAMLSIPYNEKYFKSNKLFSSMPELPENTSEVDPSRKIIWADSIIEIPEVTIKAPPGAPRLFHDKYEEMYQYAEIKSLDYNLLWTSATVKDALYKVINPYVLTDTYVILRQPHSLFGGPAIALVVLDGMPIPYKGWEQVRSIPASEITSLTVLMGPQGYTLYGEAAQGGVIFVNTRSDDPHLMKLRTDWLLQNKKNNMLLPINLYRANKEFYSPAKFEIENDPDVQNRSTIYWAPEVYFNGNEPVRIRYNNLKHYGPVIITINGASFNNLVGSGRAGYQIDRHIE